MKSLTDIFINTNSIDEFKEEIYSLNGNFLFDSSSMLKLAKKYFEKYPDSFSNRNMEEVHLGYSLVRICISEKILIGFTEEKKSKFRNIFLDSNNCAQIIEDMITTYGPEEIAKDYKIIIEKLDTIKTVIDEIPKSIFKERFIGGITNIYNISYLIKMNIKKHSL